MNAIDTLFHAYLEDGNNYTDRNEEKENELRRVSTELDAAIEAGDKSGTINTAGAYEYAAREAGFYAGFLAAMSILDVRTAK